MLDDNGHHECTLYDVIFQISHQARIALDSACPPKDDVLSLVNEIPKEITDKDLDSHGLYNFHKLLKIGYPKDFMGLEKMEGNLLPGKHTMDVLSHGIDIKLSNNYDLDAAIEFEFDQALFAMTLSEII